MHEIPPLWGLGKIRSRVRSNTHSICSCCCV